jgi:choline dehydrogenase-like flavoprotein
MRSTHEPDVVIVGAGAAGSVYAAVLAEAGKSVLVLETGPARKLTDLYSSQIWARRLKWCPPHVEEGDSIGVNFNTGHGFGGAAVHHYAVWPRFHEDDMRMASKWGRGLDWPYDYRVLRPFYDQVQREVGVSGDAELEVWRPPGDPYPLPPVLVSNHGTVLHDGFAKQGLRTAPIPMAVLSRAYNGRTACVWDGWCDAGCPIGALANPLVVYLPRAVKAGAVMRANCHVTRVLLDNKGKRAIGVEYFDEKGGKHFQPAKAVVLAAFSIENPRILLNSANRFHPEGVGNSSGLLGRYLMSHLAVGITGMFPDNMQNYLGATGGQLICQDHFAKDKVPGAFGSRQWEIAQALKPNDLLGIAMSRPDIIGPELGKFMKQAATHLGSMLGVCEDLPNEENRVRLAQERDKFGFRLAQVTYKYGADARALRKAALDEGVAIFKAAGATSVWSGPPVGLHIMGGCVMGVDPSKSVTDADGRLHDVGNIVVGGPSVFPTASCANATFTVHAVAMKSAKALVQQWGAIAA